MRELKQDSKPNRSKKPHPRLADIQAAQPPLKTLKGIGNYNQYSKYMLNNGRKR